MFNHPQIVPNPNSRNQQTDFSAKFSISSEEEYDWRTEDGVIQKVRVYKSEIGQRPADINSEYIYRYKTLIPQEDQEDSLNFTIITQWHDTPDKSLGETYRQPPLTLTTKDKKFAISNRWSSKQVSQKGEYDGKLTYDLGNYEEDTWCEWVIHVRWSSQDDGFLEVWKNNELVVQRIGPNTYNDAKAPFFRVGLYQPGGWERNPGREATLKELLIDDVEITNINGGNHNLTGDDQDNTYLLSQQSASGSKIADIGGRDSISFGDLELTFSDFLRSENNLIIDINQDRKFDETNDLTIINFWSLSERGEGYIETLNNIKGVDVFKLFQTNSYLVEAENLRLNGYTIQNKSFASNGALTHIAPDKLIGSASLVFPQATGVYDILVAYHDELDGEAQLTLKVNGTKQGRLIFDNRLPGNVPTPENFQLRSIAEQISLTTGDRVELVGRREDGEPARLDYIQFVPVEI